MKVTLDLNVLLDVVQKRVPHYQDSAEVLTRGRSGELDAVLPGHAVTTLYYVIAKWAGRAKADQTVDWLLAHFDIGAADKAIFRRARQLAMADFEDAVVASLAEAGRCDYVATRNVSDFAGSPVPAITPSDLLKLLP
ncbi:MAG: PIN domain-containing protein [Verrucomicrobia bacterium]|nr:PIN domain-containing protein [Verrucomicrobiota bacterium]